LTFENALKKRDIWLVRAIQVMKRSSKCSAQNFGFELSGFGEGMVYRRGVWKPGNLEHAVLADDCAQRGF
jgi:hypothetical protein